MKFSEIQPGDLFVHKKRRVFVLVLEITPPQWDEIDKEEVFVMTSLDIERNERTWQKVRLEQNVASDTWDVWHAS